MPAAGPTAAVAKARRQPRRRRKQSLMASRRTMRRRQSKRVRPPIARTRPEIFSCCDTHPRRRPDRSNYAECKNGSPDAAASETEHHVRFTSHRGEADGGHHADGGPRGQQPDQTPARPIRPGRLYETCASTRPASATATSAGGAVDLYGKPVSTTAQKAAW